MSTYESQMEEKEMEEVALSLVKAMKGIGRNLKLAISNFSLNLFNSLKVLMRIVL